MSEKIVVRFAEDVCCPHCIKLFPLADGLLRSPIRGSESCTELPVVTEDREGPLVSRSKR